MKFIKPDWFPILLGMVALCVILREVLPSSEMRQPDAADSIMYDERTNEWHAPDIDTVAPGKDGDLIRYGQDLIVHTSFYLGPGGKVAAITNGMNCQNCHLDAGTRYYGNCFSAVASIYPIFRPRSGLTETMEFRINDCLKRSLNGKPIDTMSKEMKAMVAYLEWLGKDVPKNIRPNGASIEELTYLARAADTARGKLVYTNKCQLCHSSNGEGVANPGGTGFIYPPLWGDKSYNTGAGLFRLSRFAGYVKNTMPFGTAAYGNPGLTDEEAWDVAAFVNSQPRPIKSFPEDWPDINKKAIDYPFGPYADGYSERQHKYGPFGSMKEAKKDKR